MAGILKATTVRFDERDKAAATEILDSIGISLATYLNMAVKQLINKRRVPFELEAASDVPNEETMRAIVEAEAKQLGIIEDDAVRFASARDAVEYLRSL